MSRKEFYKTRIDKIAKESFNAEQKVIAKKIIEAADEKDLDAVWGLVSQRVKIGFTFDEAPEVNHNAVSVVKENEKLFIGSTNTKVIEHKLIIGENYDALKNLLATYTDSQGKGLIDVIYIDPPYNTEKGKEEGNDYKEEVEAKKFIYRDKFTRDGWLNMMNERLKPAKRLLSDKGIIFISIDDSMHAYLKVLCDDIFGEDNFIGTIAWESKTKSQNTKDSYNKLQPKVEYILLYTKGGKRRFNLIDKGVKNYPEKDSRGEFRWYKVETMNALDMRGRGTMIYAIKGIMPPKDKQWKIGIEMISEFEARNDVEIINKTPFIKMRPEDERNEITEPFWAFFSKEIGTAESAKKELTEIIRQHNFETVKPVELIKRLIFHATEKDQEAVILDFFAGSGTTGQAVMELNAEDRKALQFILVTNNENNIATTVTRERLYRVINGKGSKGEKIDWEYSKDKKYLIDNALRVFDIKTESLTIAEVEKAEKIKIEAEKNFKKLNEKYKVKTDLDVYTQLASLTPYKSEK